MGRKSEGGGGVIFGERSQQVSLREREGKEGGFVVSIVLIFLHCS